MVSSTGAAAGANAAGIDASRRAQEAGLRNDRTTAEIGSSAPEARETEAPAVVYDGKVAEMRRAEEANAVQATRSPNASAVLPSARLFDITV
jgi:hypothetical protein